MKSARCLSPLVDSPRRCFNYTRALSLVARLAAATPASPAPPLVMLGVRCRDTHTAEALG